MRCCSPVMIWGRGRCRRVGRNFGVFVLKATPRMAARKKFSGKKLRHFLPGELWCGLDHFWKVNSAQTLSRQPEEKLSTEENTSHWGGNTGNKWKIHLMKTHEAYSPFTSWYHWHARSRLVGTCDLNTVWMQHRKDYPLLLVVSIKVKNLIFRRTTAVYRPLLEK